MSHWFAADNLQAWMLEEYVEALKTKEEGKQISAPGGDND